MLSVLEKPVEESSSDRRQVQWEPFEHIYRGHIHGDGEEDLEK